MPTPRTSDRNEELSRDVQVALSDLIVEQVIHSLGSPEKLFKVQVYRVGSERYRVNVFVGEDATSSRVAHSFYLTVDDEGNILTSTPEIVRMY